jgi:enoyl-CoA hydratase/carnithine racemase
MSSYSTLKLERDGGVAKLVLNRPDAANARWRRSWCDAGGG